MTETRSAALPACSDGFDNIDGGPERGVYIQMGGVEQVRIGRALQRGRTAAHIALVPAQDIGKHIGKRRRLTDLAELAGATARAYLRARGYEDLHVGVREDHRTGVASIEHRAGAREIAL